MAMKINRGVSEVKENLLTAQQELFQLRLAEFLSQDELEATEISFVDGEVFFSAQDSILQKIKQSMPVRRI